MLDAIIGKLSGYKTYILALAYGIDAAGAQMGWWDEASSRTIIEQVLGIIFLRDAIQKSGPVSASPVTVLPASAKVE
jgi:hypothetical protein